MVCNVVRYSKNNQSQTGWGVLFSETIFPLSGDYQSTAEFLNEGKEEALSIDPSKKSKNTISLFEVTLLSPVTKPCLVLCQGANYREHMIESGMNPDDKNFNMFFNKSAASISGPSDDIIKPNHVSLLDYEVELGLVIGKNITSEEKISRRNIGDYVAGVVIGNDVSARDVQVPQMQFFKGKSYRSFCPVGPVLCLLSKEELSYLDDLELTLTVNDELRQQDNTRNLVFKPDETLTELSQVSDMRVGDLVLTGTPAGCALRIPSPLVTKIGALLPEKTKWKMFKKTQGRRSQYLNAGDVVRATIRSLDGVVDLGTQENRVV
ncbi:fumarylacetoacetate hydrolase [Gammaproteobacteria bacterium 45_16_T64]|nr:fumarylacetoacetate hydrolase [Gammaproteobacteria bacterium 45_16_T64]